MKLFRRQILVILLAFSSLISFAQAFEENHDRIYGYDPLLYNGRIYTFSPQPGTIGTQFLYPDFDKKGTATLRGIVYSDLTINYDVYNQQLVLKYVNSIGSGSQIEVSEAWLESFELYGSHFEILSTIDTTKRIFQVLGKGKVKIAYYRRKELALDTRTSSRNHFFSDPLLERFVMIGSKMDKYKNNRSFVAIFNPVQQDIIKKYLRKNKIKVKKANDMLMTDLINYCNTLGGS
jgi:hypothetical protein